MNETREEIEDRLWKIALKKAMTPPAAVGVYDPREVKRRQRDAARIARKMRKRTKFTRAIE